MRNLFSSGSFEPKRCGFLIEKPVKREFSQNDLTATVLIHVDQVVQDACTVSSPLEGSGELEAAQGDGFSNTTPCSVWHWKGVLTWVIRCSNQGVAVWPHLVLGSTCFIEYLLMDEPVPERVTELDHLNCLVWSHLCLDFCQVSCRSQTIAY